jgi:hypothetical protein
MQLIDINPLVEIVEEEIARQDPEWAYKVIATPTEISIRQARTKYREENGGYKTEIANIKYFDDLTGICVQAYFENSASMIQEMARRIDNTPTRHKVVYAQPVKGTSFETQMAPPTA